MQTAIPTAQASLTTIEMVISVLLLVRMANSTPVIFSTRPYRDLAAPSISYPDARATLRSKRIFGSPLKQHG